MLRMVSRDEGRPGSITRDGIHGCMHIVIQANGPHRKSGGPRTSMTRRLERAGLGKETQHDDVGPADHEEDNPRGNVEPGASGT